MADPQTRFPIPLCFNAETASARPALRAEDLLYLSADLCGADRRNKSQTFLATDSSVDDATDLTQAGWGAVFASDADPRIHELLQPLLDLRRQQVQDPRLFKIFEGPRFGVRAGMTANSWAYQRGVSLTAPVNPIGGVPYYLLLVGSPQAISFEFQALLKMQFAVGRLSFDDVEDYGRYARNVVAYENETFTPPQRRNATLWMTQNQNDDATFLLSTTMSQDFLNEDAPLGNRLQFGVTSYVGEKATKAQLREILSGEGEGGPPAVLFTGSHGINAGMSDPEKQRLMQGALLTNDWVPGAVLDATNQFCGADVPASPSLLGTMVFLFACFGGGCPAVDSYAFQADGSPIRMAGQDMIAQLPQALLRNGVLAVFAHIDVAFCYSFLSATNTVQTQVIRTPLENLMKGHPAGLAADALTSLWSSLSVQVGESLAHSAHGAEASPDAASFANLTVARDDARNYIVLGDPAVRLRVRNLFG